VHLVDDEIADLVEKEVRETEMLAAVIDRPSHDLAEDIIAALVARQYAVDDRERRRACVVGDDATRELLGF